MGNVQLRCETVQRTQLIEATAAIHKYDITVANEGQIGLQKLKTDPSFTYGSLLLLSCWAEHACCG